MKNFKQFIFLTLLMAVAAVGLQSCSKDDGASDSGTFIRFTTEGTDYDFRNIISAQSLALTLNGNNGEGITNVGDTQISIWLPVEPTVGAFDIVDAFDDGHRVSFSSESLGFDFDFARSGNITVTEITDNFISGTFTATITSGDDTTIVITNGEFRGEMF